MTGKIRSILASIALTLGLLTVPAVYAYADECVARSPENLAQYDQLASVFVANNQLTASEADLFRCHPEKTSSGLVGGVESRATGDSVATLTEASTSAVDVAAASAAMCSNGYTLKQSRNHIITRDATPEIFKYTSTLRWCYNKKLGYVSDWSGECTGTVTTWGAVNGWSFEGCTKDQMIPYALGGHYPGGVHHVTVAHFTNNFTAKTLTSDLGPVSIWGHFDGTCDWRPPRGPTYNYC